MKKGSNKKGKGTKQRQPIAALRVPHNGEHQPVIDILVEDSDPRSSFVQIYWVGEDGKKHIWGSTSRIVFNMIKAHFTREGLPQPTEKQGE